MLVDELFVESRQCPLGIDVERPALGWSYKSESARSQNQSAYRIIVSDNEVSIQHGIGNIWDSGKVTSRKNVHILYDGPALISRTRYYWQVQVWDSSGHMTKSAVAFWEMGLLTDKDWSAQWIGAADEEQSDNRALPLFRCEFELEKPVATARAYICGLGQYELRLNGTKVGDHVLDPGWTNYNKTCLYSTYDVTKEVTEGANAIGVMLGNGFFNVTGGRYKKFKGSFGSLRFLVQLEVTYTDGSTATIASSQDWRTTAGPITFACIYGGEDYDACREPIGWDQPDFLEDSAWKHAAIVDSPTGQLKSQALHPLKVMKTFKPISITQPAPGVYIADFGQNFSGWVEISVIGPKGAQITLSPGELLKDNGYVNQKWTGSPYRFNYITSGSGLEVWSPRFSYYGFRYVQIEGAIPAKANENPTEDSPILVRIEGQMIYPDTKSTGSFESSDSILNRTHEIINWAVLSNMKSIFTDCPHREKLGWLEQIHLMGPSVAYNYQIEALLTKTMEDIRDAQLPNGMVPTTAPEYVEFSEQWRCFRDSVSWGAAYVLTGWNLLRLYGNSRILTEHYDGMKAYVDYITSASEQLIVTVGLGDWYDVNDDGPGFAKNTPIAHTETAMFYHMVDIFTQIASLLNKTEEALQYSHLRDEIKLAFNKAFFDPVTTQYATGSQTSNAMPLVLGLVDEDHKEQLLSHLIESIQQNGYHTTAGDVGHRYVLLALAQNGRSDIIYQMAKKTDFPSYGYQIAHGATTLTEAWDGPTIGKSQNHFMLGHLEEWLYRYLAGVDYVYEPSLETYRITIHPALPNGLEAVIAEHHLPVGKVRVAWKCSNDNGFTLDVELPANCIGDVYVPASASRPITENGKSVEETPAQGIEAVSFEVDSARFRIASGQYHFAGALSANRDSLSAST
ncbi:Bacterial alpha-L-rhamnosidase [Paenibacillus sp. LMG 31456]|uniref:alpha-L-rhamnosidase n=1 Tax=Paenibacillus foliorum TaxID=2654974 RepID=A0A972GUE2_9BACL|nr:alpha-L-rhamnosidase [Paenibacillus foliorum]NOU96882.1 Bacterial alpha-L-rhamnosidase [Paenibacillus foliorum]